MEKEIIVYTIITNNYDELIELKYVNTNIRYICFTDNSELTSNTWEVIYMPDLYYKEYKCLPPIVGYSVHLDGNMELLQDIHPLVDEFINSQSSIGVYKAKENNCAYKEIKTCIKGNLDTKDNLDKVKDFLLSENYPKNNGMTPSGLLFRKHDNTTLKQGKLWLSLIKTLSKRDQTTFNYTLWKLNIKPYIFDRNVFEDEYIKWRVSHGNV
jgi:hypothetical protein